MTLKPWSQLYTVRNAKPGEHAFVDTLLRIRKNVFVDELGWTLKTDEKGREIDQFDVPEAEHTAIIANGEIKAFGRLLPTDKTSLLFDVYPGLIDADSGFQRGPNVWEGTRMGTPSYVPIQQKARWLRRLVLETAARKHREGITSFCSVSDPILERILKRTGICLQRLGRVKRDMDGKEILALRLDCDVSAFQQTTSAGLTEIVKANQAAV